MISVQISTAILLLHTRMGVQIATALLRLHTWVFVQIITVLQLLRTRICVHIATVLRHLHAWICVQIATALLSLHTWICVKIATSLLLHLHIWICVQIETLLPRFQASDLNYNSGIVHIIHVPNHCIMGVVLWTDLFASFHHLSITKCYNYKWYKYRYKDMSSRIFSICLYYCVCLKCSPLLLWALDLTRQ